ncbi:hypothetical protein PVK06_039564 [Gossypium arboreum]|uniref:Uncharacterized protein n=1 Tax=Gossypium arboreum TaxID=29729 RepID=A0ABR0N5E4_GOSAR|nr:hypothetical protein PVK06_039564 [Gossypium arboreum]
MSLCQQKGIVPRRDEEIIDNKGPINEASVERITYDIETPILKEVGTNTTKKAKAKANSKGTTLHTETSLWHGVSLAKVAEVTSEKQDNSLEIVVYTGPLQVASLIQEATDDTGAEPEHEEQSKNRESAKKRKGNASRTRKRRRK